MEIGRREIDIIPSVVVYTEYLYVMLYKIFVYSR